MHRILDPKKKPTRSAQRVVQKEKGNWWRWWNDEKETISVIKWRRDENKGTRDENKRTRVGKRVRLMLFVVVRHSSN